MTPPRIKETPARTICLLLRDGRLFGPFRSRDEAIFWAAQLELIGFSTYELRAPTVRQNIEPP